MLKTLAGQLAPQGGAVLLDGQDLTAYTPNARARKLALMLPHTARTELTTCFDGGRGRPLPLHRAAGHPLRRRQAAGAGRLALVAGAGRPGFSKISDGQRQRVLLARAVCQQPEILLLDEPTSFLDIKGKAELMTILQTLAHEKNVAVIVTLHELDWRKSWPMPWSAFRRQGVSGVLTPQDAFAAEYPCPVRPDTEQYAALFPERR